MAREPLQSFRIQGVTVYHADCMDVLPYLEGVDCVVTDPPYGVELEAKRAKQRNGDVISRPGSYDVPDTPEYVNRVVVPTIKRCIEIASCVVVTPGTRNMWLYPVPDDLGCWYSAAATGMGRWGFTCAQPILYYGRDPYLANALGARPNSCGQVYPNDANDVKHPCAKPRGFVLWLVERASLPNWLILDPFAGSGTTGVAAIKTGRRAILIEKDPRYIDVIRKRLTEAATPLFPIEDAS